MVDTIRKASYYYTTAPDKPGEGARLLQALRNAVVNLLAFHAFPSARKYQADFVPADASPAARLASLRRQSRATIRRYRGVGRALDAPRAACEAAPALRRRPLAPTAPGRRACGLPFFF